MKPKRRKRGAFGLPAIRRGEIERHALHVGAADTEDFWRWLVAWCWHNEQNTRDRTGALQLAAERMGGSISEAEAEAILERADGMRQQRTADRLARFLGRVACATMARCLWTRAGWRRNDDGDLMQRKETSK